MIITKFNNKVFRIIIILLVTALMGCNNSIYKAIEKGDNLTVQRYINNEENVNLRSMCMNCLTIRGETLLEHASRYGKTEIVKLLLDNDANLNGEELMYAADGNWVEIVSLLINNGAKVNNEKNISIPLIYSLAINRKEVAEILQENRAKISSEYAYLVIPDKRYWGNVILTPKIDKKDLPYTKSYFENKVLFLSPGMHSIDFDLEVTLEGGSVYKLDSERKDFGRKGIKYRWIITKMY